MIARVRQFFSMLQYYIKNDIENFRPKCAILIYHRVCKLDNDPQFLCVAPHNFDAQLSILKKKYKIISIQTLVNCLISKKAIPRNSVCITFDDGYADNLYNALPVIEKYKIPVTIFISTNFMNSFKEYWWDELERIFLINPIHKTLSIDIKGKRYNWTIQNDEDSLFVYKQIHPLLKYITENERETVINSLFEWAQKDRNQIRKSHRSLNESEVKKLSDSSCIEIGSHTLSHPCLSAEKAELQNQQIAESKIVLETLLGKPILSFSYPFGGLKDFNDKSKASVFLSGYNCGIANFPGLTDAKTDIFSIPRNLIRDWNPQQFEAEINSLFSGKPGIVTGIKQKIVKWK